MSSETAKSEPRGQDQPAGPSNPPVRSASPPPPKDAARVIRGRWHGDPEGGIPLAGDGSVAATADGLELRGQLRRGSLGTSAAVWFVIVAFAVTGIGIPIAAIGAWLWWKRTRPPVDELVPWARVGWCAMDGARLRVEAITRRGPASGALVPSDAADTYWLAGVVSRAETAAARPGGEEARRALPRIYGRWQRHWRLFSEFVGPAELHASAAGLHVVGRRTYLLRTVAYMLGCLVGWLLLAVVVVGAPIFAAWVADEANLRADDLIPIGLLLSLAALLCAVPAWLVWRALAVPTLRELVPWEYVEGVAVQPDGFWLRAATSRGTISGHLRRVPHADLRLLIERGRSWRPELPDLGVRGLLVPIWADRAIIATGVLAVLAFGWWLKQQPPDWLAQFEARASQAMTRRDDVETPELKALRERAAGLLAQSPPTWDKAASLSQNGAVLSARLQTLLAGVDANSIEGGRAASVEAFLSLIPFPAILEAVSFGKNVPALAGVAEQLDAADPSAGDGFLLSLAATFIDRHPPRAENSDAVLGIAESWLATAEDRECAGLVGRFLVGRLVADVEKAVREDRMGQAEAMLLAKRVGALGGTLDVPLTSVQKLALNLASGNSAYVQQRMAMKLAELLGDSDTQVRGARDARYVLVEVESAARGSWLDAKLQRDGSRIGWVGLARTSTPWVRHAWIPAAGRTLSVKNVSKILGGRRPLALAAASYVTSAERTSGLAAAGGSVTNFAASPRMDALVLIHGGLLSVHNLREGVRVPGGEQLDVLGSIEDYRDFVAWLRRERASCFQTHLLGWNDDLALDPGRASAEPRERRLLATLARGDDRAVAIVDLPARPRPLSLAEAGTVVLTALQQAGWRVDAVANLDVGSFNILAVTRGGGVEGMGEVDLEKAHNLLVAYEK